MKKNQPNTATGLLLEINLGHPGSNPLSHNDKIWDILNTHINVDRISTVILLGETLMWQPRFETYYIRFIQKISHTFIHASFYYFGKQANSLSPEFAACINTREIKIWHDSSSLLSHNINIDKWYCFSHRCLQSALLKKIIIKKITGHSHTTWYGPKEIAQMGAGLQKTIRCIQHIWKQYREKKHPPIPTPPLTYKPSHASPRILQRKNILKVNPYSLFITKPRPNPYFLLTNKGKNINPYSLFITKPRPNPYSLLTNNSTLVR